jgi:hypothetical protein
MNDEQQLEWLSEPRKDGSIGDTDDPACGWVDIYEWQQKFTWQLAQIKALTEKLDKAVAALEAVEWGNAIDGGIICPWCGRRYFSGHADYCPRQSALAAAKGAPMT